MMYELNGCASASIEVKGSKFLAFLEPCNNQAALKARQEELRALHPKCVHVVYAQRYLNEFDQICENQSDDKEPKGSSGPPALNALRGAELINCACFIVRYFGGTLLGVGGLVRAYTQAVNEAITTAKKSELLSEYIKKESFKIELNYSELNKITHTLDGLKIRYSKDFSDLVILRLELSAQEFSNLNEVLKDSQIKIQKD